MQLDGASLRVASLAGTAAASGLRVGDSLVKIDGLPVADLDPNAARFLLADHDAGSPAKITALRDGTELSFEVLAEPPPAPRP